MSKKDYILIARVIKQNTDYQLQSKAQVTALKNLAFDFSHILHLDNAKFDSAKFLSACGINN